MNLSAEVTESSRKPQHRIAGLDSIRFLCAMLVVFDHMGVLGFAKPHDLHGFSKLAWTVQGNVVNGPAAVIIFFIISGFCIHFPYRSRPIDLRSYYSRRLIRISLPAIAAILIRRFFLRDLTPITETVLWSVICEAIYYLLYPFLRTMSKTISWARMAGVLLVLSLAVALAFMFTHPGASNGYGESGILLTAFIGLPCWLMGCWLAESQETFSLPSTASMWAWRCGLILVTVGLRIVKFHVVSPFASNAFTLNLFALLALAWLGREIAYRKVHAPAQRLEWAGRWSYSLYLVHGMVYPALVAFSLVTIASRNTFTHAIVILLTMALAYGFFLLVEFPSHKLAMLVSSRVKKVQPPEKADVLPQAA